MPFTSEEIETLNQLKELGTYVVNILDRESAINGDNRQLSSTNITDLNSLYTDIIAKLNDIVDSLTIV